MGFWYDPRFDVLEMPTSPAEGRGRAMSFQLCDIYSAQCQSQDEAEGNNRPGPTQRPLVMMLLNAVSLFVAAAAACATPPSGLPVVDLGTSAHRAQLNVRVLIKPTP